MVVRLVGRRCVARGWGIEERGFRGGGWIVVAVGLVWVRASAVLGRGMLLGGEALFVWGKVVVEGSSEVARLADEGGSLMSCSVRRKLERVLWPL